MVQRMYVVYDKVAQESGPPFVAKNDGVAMRSYLHLLKEVRDQAEYRLYCIGTFETDDMSLVVLPEPLEIIEMSEVES